MNNYYHNYRGNNRGCRPYKGKQGSSRIIIEVLNKGEGDNKTTIWDNTKQSHAENEPQPKQPQPEWFISIMGNMTTPMNSQRKLRGFFKYRQCCLYTQ